MQRLIFFIGVDHTLTQFTEELAHAAGVRGIPHVVLDVTEGREVLIRQIGAFAAEGPCAAVIFNNIYLPLPGDDCSLWQRLNIPVFNILMDHPRNYARFLDMDLPTMRVLTVDRRHEAFIHEYYPQVRRTAFLPHGGTEWDGLSDDAKPWTERSIDILLLSGQLPEPKWPVIPWLQDGGQQFYETTLRAMISQPSLETEKAAYLAADELRISMSNEQWKSVFENDILACEWEARRLYKEEIIRLISETGIPAHIYGSRWEWASGLPGIHVHPPIPVWDCFPLLADAKIVLNVMPWFKEGAHDRIFTGMLNGAVCVTDTSEYLLEHYTHGKDIVYYDLTDLTQLTDHLRYLLEHPEQAAAIASAGQEKARREDTWGNRLDALIEMMQVDAG